MSDIMDFTLIGGWHLEAEADEENQVLHMTISNVKGDITDGIQTVDDQIIQTDLDEPKKEFTFSFVLVEEDKDEEV
tara:strand:+ start:886 stop:1113 length:228 start_codon:yes stop_codon:yes gene_type:complete